MPNWCSNIVYVKGTKEAKEKVKDIFSKDEPFAEIKPHPPGEGGENGWRNWRRANWGTKWEPTELGVDLDDEGNLTLVFDTAWTPPAPGLEELSKMEGVEEVVSHFYESGSDFIGIEFFEGGETVEALIPDYDEFMELLQEAKEKDKGEVLLEEQWALDLASMFLHEDEY